MFNSANENIDVQGKIEDVIQSLLEVKAATDRTVKSIQVFCTNEFYVKLSFTIKCGKNKRKWEAYKRGNKHWNKI
jgi:hypothetical protein